MLTVCSFGGGGGSGVELSSLVGVALPDLSGDPALRVQGQN